MTKAEFNALYNLFEAVATAIDKCHLRKTQRERVGANGKIKVPDSVELSIVAFEGGEPLKIKARFYFKLSGGQVVFSIKLLNLRETILESFREVCGKIAKNTGLALHYVK